MTIILHLDDVMALKRVSVTELAEAVGITRANMSNLKTGKVKAIRFSTFNEICKYLECQPGEIIEFIEDEK